MGGVRVSMRVRASVRACVQACVHACMHVCKRECERAGVHVQQVFTQEHMHAHTTHTRQGGNVVGAVAPSGSPTHIDRVRNATLGARAHEATFVDLALLAGAACLVTSKHSGFSHHAWLAGGGKACHRVLTDCDEPMATGSGGG